MLLPPRLRMHDDGGSEVSYVISAEYGELLEGYAETNEALGIAVRNCRFAEIPALVQERAAWVEVMARCPMFVQDGSRANG